MFTKQLREMERQASVVTIQNDYYKTKITQSQWKRYKTEYRKWYKNHFGKNRSPIITDLDYSQLISYIQAKVLPNMPTSGIVEIIGKNGYSQDIHYIVNCR